jgi:Cysteine-rich CPCC
MVIDGKNYFGEAATVVSMRRAVAGLFPCPFCEHLELVEAGGWEICSNCGWEDDPVQEKHTDLAGGANRLSLNAARLHFKQNGWSEPRLITIKLPD